MCRAEFEQQNRTVLRECAEQDLNGKVAWSDPREQSVFGRVAWSTVACGGPVSTVVHDWAGQVLQSQFALYITSKHAEGVYQAELSERIHILRCQSAEHVPRDEHSRIEQDLKSIPASSGVRLSVA